MEQFLISFICYFAHLCLNINCCSTFSVQSIEQLENELLNGQKLQGPATASEVHIILKQKNMLEK